VDGADRWVTSEAAAFPGAYCRPDQVARTMIDELLGCPTGRRH
jgi:hypothetical protein